MTSLTSLDLQNNRHYGCHAVIKVVLTGDIEIIREYNFGYIAALSTNASKSYGC